MEQVQNSMYVAFGTGTAVTAISIALALFMTTSATADQVVQVNAGKDHNLEARLQTPELNTVSGAQVLQTLFQINDLQTDIQVDGVLFSKDMDMEHTDVFWIATGKTYVPTYLRNSDGTVLKIVFTSH